LAWGEEPFWDEPLVEGRVLWSWVCSSRILGSAGAWSSSAFAARWRFRLRGLAEEAALVDRGVDDSRGRLRERVVVEVSPALVVAGVGVWPSDTVRVLRLRACGGAVDSDAGGVSWLTVVSANGRAAVSGEVSSVGVGFSSSKTADVLDDGRGQTSAGCALSGPRTLVSYTGRCWAGVGDAASLPGEMRTPLGLSTIRSKMAGLPRTLGGALLFVNSLLGSDVSAGRRSQAFVLASMTLRDRTLPVESTS
jgi:hypothetical protein